MKMKALKKPCYYLLIVISLGYYIWMAEQIPYAHDDWMWGGTEGIKHLLSADLNSRYVGNLIEVVLTRWPVIKTVVMGLTYTLIMVLSTEFVVSQFSTIPACNRRYSIRICVFSTCNIIMLALPADVWAQTNGWPAGFSNFTVSALGLVIYYCYLSGMYKKACCIKNEKVYSTKMEMLFCIITMLFGISIQLFIENLTLYFCIISFLFLLEIFSKHASAMTIRAVFLLLGTVIGLLIMFSSSMYNTLFNTGSAVDGYRQLMYSRSEPLYSFIYYAAVRYITEYIPMLIGHHGLLSMAIGGMLFLIGIVKTVIQWNNKKQGVVYVFFDVINIFYVLYYSYYLSYYFRGQVSYSPNAGFDGMFVITVTLEIIFFFFHLKRLLFIMLSIWLSGLFILAPMVFVNTMGPRCYYASYLCLTIVCLILVAYCISVIRCNICLPISLVCTVGLFIFGKHMAKVYYPIGMVNRERLKMIQTAIDKQNTTIILPPFPNDEYLWYATPTERIRLNDYRNFYGVPDDTKIEFAENWAAEF